MSSLQTTVETAILADEFLLEDLRCELLWRLLIHAQ
jgi:hypothetical protein